MNISQYKNFLSSHGETLGQVRRNQSDVLVNSTFTQDPSYKRVYILTKDGWKWEDARYQAHSATSILKDPVDYYLQFRPKVHYPVGSYVIVPDDTSPNVNLTTEELCNPFSQPMKNRTQWWFIVGRDEASDYVKYMILKCDWEFRWVYKGKLMSCWACSRNANSYTSGVWRDQYSSSLDDLTQAWLPDLRYTYGDRLEHLDMCDTRTIMHGQRFILSNNDLDPKVYEVTKIKDINPQGVIKLSIKQHEINTKRDNLELRVCDYYTDDGDIQIETPIIEEQATTSLDYSEILWMTLNENGELEENTDPTLEVLKVGQTSYFEARFYRGGNPVDIDGQWRIRLADTEGLSDEDISYYDGLMKLNKFDSCTVSLKPGKASSLKGLKFILSVESTNGQYMSSIEVEVSK